MIIQFCEEIMPNISTPFTQITPEEIRAHWKGIMFEGILFLVLGCIALIAPTAFSLGYELVVGWLFLVGGAVQLYRSIQSNYAPGFWFVVLLSVMSMLFGILLVFHPLQGLVALTLIIGAFFFVEGIIKIIFGFTIQNFGPWGWIVLSGLFSVIISLIVFTGFPFTASWFIGTLIGVYLVVNGLGFMMLSYQAHREDKQSRK
jgi:uncharacterized membrane protein HdeD (DUF308 family)